MSLDPSRFTENEYVNQNWTLTVEANTTLEDVLKPEFLANVANRLHPYDHIRVRIDTGEWYAELLVLDCARVWAKLKVLHVFQLTEENAEKMTDDALECYTIDHRGPHLKWSVIRKADNEPIKEQCSNKREAQDWLASYLLTL